MVLVVVAGAVISVGFAMVVAHSEPLANDYRKQPLRLQKKMLD